MRSSFPFVAGELRDRNLAAFSHSRGDIIPSDGLLLRTGLRRR